MKSASIVSQIRRIVQRARERKPDVLRVLQDAYTLGRQVMPARSRFAKEQSYERAQLFAMMVLKLYRDLSYRETEEEFLSSLA